MSHIRPYDAPPPPTLTPPEHSHSAAVEEAARWLAEHRKTLTRPIIPTLVERFGLSTLDAVRAAAEAVRYEVRP